MKGITELNEFILESDRVNADWRTNAKTWTKMYRGDQWNSDDRSRLEAEQRPVLTFNILRPLVRLLTGTERKTRYDIKVLPTGEGNDHEIARLLTGFIRQVESDNHSQYTYSEAYQNGLITGRGWIKADVNYDRNIWGDIKLTSIDPYEIWVDPYTRQMNLSDSRYLIRELFLTKDEVIQSYPKFKKKLDKLEMAAPEYGDLISDQRETYKLYEVWYKEYVDHYYLTRRDTGDVILVENNQLKDIKGVVAENEMLELNKFTRPEMYYAVISLEEVLEQGRSPYNHNLFPYTPFFCEFTPRLGDVEPAWASIITDLVDPQQEKNKRYSLFLDILLRFVNKGFLYAEGALTNEDELDQMGKTPGFKIKTTQDGYEKFQIIEGSAPDASLLGLDALSEQNIERISGIPPSMKGFEESSRESGRTVMLRQQQGHAMLAPYQDHMRMTRQLVATQIMSLIQQVYTVNRMVRMISDDGKVESMQLDEKQAQKLQNVMSIKDDVSIGRYDVTISDSPSTPTTRQAEFIELLEMMSQGVLPPTPGIIRLVLKTSDISVKAELLDIIDQEIQQAKQEQKQAQVEEAMLKG